MTEFCEWYKKFCFGLDSGKTNNSVILGNHIKFCSQCQKALASVGMDAVVEIRRKAMAHEDKEWYGD